MKIPTQKELEQLENSKSTFKEIMKVHMREPFNDKEIHRFGAGIGEGKTPNAPSIEKNHHPTVKPTDLMQYLCRLITPPSGTILDPFLGSGSTGKAAMYEGFKFVGIELTDEYLPIAKARIEFALANLDEKLF